MLCFKYLPDFAKLLVRRCSEMKFKGQKPERNSHKMNNNAALHRCIDLSLLSCEATTENFKIELR